MDRDPRGLLRPVGSQCHRQAPQHHLLLIHSLITKGKASAHGNSTLAHIKVTPRQAAVGNAQTPLHGAAARNAQAGLDRGKPAEGQATKQLACPGQSVQPQGDARR